MNSGRRKDAAKPLMDRGYPRKASCRLCGIPVPSSRHVPNERRSGLKERVLELAKRTQGTAFAGFIPFLDGVNLKAVHRLWNQRASHFVTSVVAVWWCLNVVAPPSPVLTMFGAWTFATKDFRMAATGAFWESSTAFPGNACISKPL